MSSNSSFTLRLAVGCVLATSAPLVAGQAEPDPAVSGPEAAGNFERLTVIGSRDKAKLIGGAANYISPEDIEVFQHTDVHRVLKQVPGVYVVEEEGLGLRPNIGLRGSGVDRSSRITLMEDGVLIAPAPYAAPSAYYFPTMQRMEAVEIRKGSASVRSGPRTTGGAINLVSTSIPSAPLSGTGNLMYGEDATLLGHGYLGGSSEHWGFLLEGVRQETDGFKELDGGGDTGYELDDYLVKLRFNTDRSATLYQELELKADHTEQAGSETYMGLTDEDFARNPYRRYSASQLDNIDTDHDQLELRHYLRLTHGFDITTALYRNEFARNWYKVEQVGGQSLSTVLADPDTFAGQYSWLTGTTSPDDAIVLRNNNREYESQGIQTIVGWRPESRGELTHSFELGLRYHEDEEDRIQDNDAYRMQDGTLVLTTDGARGTQDNRLGQAEAFSVYVQDEISFGSWIVTPGVRYENIDLERIDYVRGDPERLQGPSRVRTSSVSEVIPGIGVVYLLDQNWSLLASMHKGFNPPAPGSSSEAEESRNYELGVRYSRGALAAELIGYWNDYDNLVGTCTASTGGNCEIGDQFDAGEVRIRGSEAALTYEWPAGDALRIPLRMSYTYTEAEFRNSFSSDFEEWGDVQAGDELPYLPPHQLQIVTGLLGDRWGVNLATAFVDEMRVEASQGAVADDQLTDAHWVVDVAANYDFTDNLSFFARLENAFDETFIVARRPAGARPGRPRTGLVGFVARF